MKRRVLIGLAIVAVAAFLVPALSTGYATDDAKADKMCVNCPCGDQCPCVDKCQCGDECPCPKKGAGCELRDISAKSEGCEKPRCGDRGGCKGKK